ncbi:MAG: GNAT family N-acetyltransferase [Candidatus Lokiarchaeota archaeon]|nr:GNAT family N-acetyltransferase [Candidatus Lokiarchaeota archaeon]
MKEQLDLMNRLVIESLSDDNISDVHQFCEENIDHWSQTLYFFRLATLNDTNFDPKLTLIAKNSQDDIIAFFQGTTRKGIPFYQPKNILKFFVVKREFRRKGLATRLLKILFKKFKEGGHKGKIEPVCCPPDYWFPGVYSKHTAAIFWLKKCGFKKHRFVNRYRQNLIVDLEERNLPIDLAKKPPTELGKYRFQRITEDYFDQTYGFVKKHHGMGSWPKETELSFHHDPPTSFIAINKENDEVIGWATHSASYGGSFGPTGVLKELRGQGIGGLLLKWTLYDLKEMGYKQCIISWVTGNTVKYYSKVAGAYIGQVFWPMTGKIKI